MLNLSPNSSSSGNAQSIRKQRYRQTYSTDGSTGTHRTCAAPMEPVIRRTAPLINRQEAHKYIAYWHSPARTWANTSELTTFLLRLNRLALFHAGFTLVNTHGVGSGPVYHPSPNPSDVWERGGQHERHHSAGPCVECVLVCASMSALCMSASHIRRTTRKCLRTHVCP